MDRDTRFKSTVLHSTVTTKGRTTIPRAMRRALNIRPGDRLVYVVEGDHVTMRVHPGVQSLAGALASNTGKGLTFKQIREASTRVRLID